jgi:hypothetical protein
MKYLALKGANFHFQARFYAESSGVIIASGNPKLVTLRPMVKDHSESAGWAQAYEFVYHFLEAHRMQETLNSLRVELGGAGEPARVGAFERAGRGAFFADLLRVAREGFGEQLESFVGPAE